MNPYGPLYSSLSDNILVGVVTLAVITSGAAWFRRKYFYEAGMAGKAWFAAFACALLSVQLAISVVQLVGLIFLFLLQIKSGFWFIWQLLYLMSVIAVFRYLPILTVGGIAWGVVGWWRARYTARALLLAALLALTMALNAGLYFAIEASAQIAGPVDVIR